MNIQLNFLNAPEWNIRSFSKKQPSSKKKSLIPVGIIGKSNVECTAYSKGGNLILSSSYPGGQEYISPASRIRSNGKNILEVEDSPEDVDLIKAIFNRARYMECDYVFIYVSDIASCLD